MLGFMSPWDRRVELRRYERMFDLATDPDRLIEDLGTPTKVAVELARNDVASPPPDASRWDELQKEGQPLPDAPEDGAEPEEEAPVVSSEPEKPKRQARPGGVIGFVLFTLVIGVPVGVALVCIGLPFLALGVSLIAAAVSTVLQNIGAFRLASDLLLALGAGMIAAAVGLLLAWFGLWLSITLCRLWIAKVLIPLANTFCYGKEARTDGR